MGFREKIKEFLLGLHVPGIFDQRNADERRIGWSFMGFLAFEIGF
jgi:hypothetical protein